MSFITENLDRIREEIAQAARRSGRKPGDITLVAVSKRKPVSAILDALSHGQSVFGENYVQEAAGKIEELWARRSEISWHYIGHLQRNKAKKAVELFDFIEAVDSIRLLKALNRHAQQAQKVMPVLLQVNIGAEESKAGILPSDLEPFVERMLSEELPGIDVQGLMILPPWSPEPEESRSWFVKARKLRDSLSERFDELDLRHLSMGMSGDFQIAIEEGATIVRVGTALFGAREPR